jgi:hypothetical protein
LQIQYDLSEAAKDKDMAKDLKGIQKVKKPASAEKAVKIKAPMKKKSRKTKTAGTVASKTTKSAARVSKSDVASESKKRGRKPKAKTPVKPSEPRKRAKVIEPKKRGRKPKAAAVIQAPQKKTFVPNVILIKQQDKPVESPPLLENNIDPLTKE